MSRQGSTPTVAPALWCLGWETEGSAVLHGNRKETSSSETEFTMGAPRTLTDSGCTNGRVRDQAIQGRLGDSKIDGLAWSSSGR